MINQKDRYSVVYPDGTSKDFQTLADARRECDRYERSERGKGAIALIYDNKRKDYVE